MISKLSKLISQKLANVIEIRAILNFDNDRQFVDNITCLATSLLDRVLMKIRNRTHATPLHPR